MSGITFRGIARDYGSVRAVAPLDLTVDSGEFFSLLGPSGSGKTSILRMTAGFLAPTEGAILIDGKDVTDHPPERRDIGVVFQNYALFPHLDVSGNVAFGLRARHLDRIEIDRRVSDVLGRTGLEGFGTRSPRDLSGGEQQRVAIARALVIEPRVLLLDEPLGALDRMLREQMQYWIKAIQNETKVTTIYVTHDQVEALTMSDRVAVLHRGHVQQVGRPADLYRRPSNRFVASFMGDNNILAGEVESVDDRGVLLRLEGDHRVLAGASDVSPVGRVDVSVRPEEISIAAASTIATGNSVPGVVEERVYRGAVNRYRVRLSDSDVIVDVDTRGSMEQYGRGDAVRITWDPEATAIIPSSDTAPAIGE